MNWQLNAVGNQCEIVPFMGNYNLEKVHYLLFSFEYLQCKTKGQEGNIISFSKLYSPFFDKLNGGFFSQDKFQKLRSKKKKIQCVI